MSTAEDENQPLARIDLTPVMGVLAALLVLFLLQVPPKVADVRVPIAPIESFGDPGRAPIEVQMAHDGKLTWNGVQLLPGEFEHRLDTLERMESPPELHVRAPGTMKFEYLTDVAAAAQRHKLHVGYGVM